MYDCINFFQNNILSILATFFLILSITSIWILKTHKSRKIVFIFTIIFAVLSDHIFTEGLLFLFIAIYLFKYLKNKDNNGFFDIFLICVICGAFFSHIIPGFNNWKLNENLILCETCFPIDFYINFDKNLIICAYFLIFQNVYSCYKGISIRVLSKYFLITSLLIFPAAVFFDVVDLDLNKEIYNIIVFSFRNLLLVCIAEEILFRKILLGSLIKKRYLNENKAILLNVLISVLFSLVHLNISVIHALLIFIASFFYGLIYIRYNKIEYSILLHFLINITHFIFFSYPYYF